MSLRDESVSHCNNSVAVTHGQCDVTQTHLLMITQLNKILQYHQGILQQFEYLQENMKEQFSNFLEGMTWRTRKTFRFVNIEGGGFNNVTNNIAISVITWSKLPPVAPQHWDNDACGLANPSHYFSSHDQQCKIPLCNLICIQSILDLR